jgi:hypothetical protein
VIVSLPSSDNTSPAVWAVECNRCKHRQLGGTTDDWLVSDDVLDVHFCPRCEKIVARKLFRATWPCLWDRVAGAAWWLVGWVKARRRPTREG